MLAAVRWLAAGSVAPIAGLLSFGMTTSAGVLVLIAAAVALLGRFVLASPGSH